MSGAEKEELIFIQLPAVLPGVPARDEEVTVTKDDKNDDDQKQVNRMWDLSRTMMQGGGGCILKIIIGCVVCQVFIFLC